MRGRDGGCEEREEVELDVGGAGDEGECQRAGCDWPGGAVTATTTNDQREGGGTGSSRGGRVCVYVCMYGESVCGCLCAIIFAD